MAIPVLFCCWLCGLFCTAGADDLQRLQPDVRCENGYYSVCNVRPDPAKVTLETGAPVHCWVAVLVAGVVGRFYPDQALKHVVKPSAKAGCVVDYYAMLSAALPDGGFSAYWYRPVENPRFSNMTWDGFEEYLMRRASRAGARRAAIYLHSDVALDSFPEDPSWRSAFRGGKKKSVTFVRNVLYLQGLEMLWNWTRGFQEHDSYTHIALMRGDIYWLQDLPIEIFDVRNTVYSRNLGHLCTDGFGEEQDNWPDDRVMVLGSNTADRVLTAYSAFMHGNSPELNAAQVNEEFLLELARLRGVRWKFVPRDLMAYFAALHMKLPDRPPFQCLRGANKKLLHQPMGRCVHPSRVELPFCEDFELL